MNRTKSAWASPLSEFQQTMDAAAEKLRNQLEDLEPYCGSQALKFAVRAGLQPQMAYTVSETSRYYGGLGKHSLCGEQGWPTAIQDGRQQECAHKSGRRR